MVIKLDYESPTPIERNHRLRPVIYGTVIVFIVVAGLVVVYRLMHHDYGITRTTIITCVDSVSGVPIIADAHSIEDGGLEDDPDKVLGIYSMNGGPITVERNVWVVVEISAVGYETRQIRLDSNSPRNIILKMSRNTQVKQSMTPVVPQNIQGEPH